MNLSVYLINLKSRPDRLEKMENQLSDRGLKYTVVEAVDGRLKAPSEYKNYNRSKRLKYYEDLVGGEIGCSTSHFKALDMYCSTSDTPFCLVLEDDAILPDNFLETLETLTTQRKGWDLIRLQRSRKQKGPVVDRVDGHEIIFPFMVGLKTTALLYTRKGAQRTRKLYQSFMFPADHVLKFAHLSGIWVYETNPTYIDQDRSEPGDIDTQHKPFKVDITVQDRISMCLYRITGQGVRLFLIPLAWLRWKKTR